MKQLTTELLAHFNGNLTSIATCWKVTRRDGMSLGFTDHDVSKTIDGLKYVASSGYFRTAIANSATTAVDNLEIKGFLDNDLISEVDLRNGAYDFAQVEIFAINWMDMSQGICRLRYGYFGEVTIRPSGLFVVELRGLLQLFSQTVGETISPDCRADLGDKRCKVKLLPDPRLSVKPYQVGDRMIVPVDDRMTSVALPIVNPNFDFYETSSYYLWQVFGGVITNYPGLPMDDEDGVFFIRPTSLSGSARRRMEFDPPSGATEFSLGFFAKATAPGWSVSGTIEVLKVQGIGGIFDETNITVLQSFDIPWTGVGTTSGWVSASKPFESNIPEEAREIRIVLKWRNGTDTTLLNTLQIDNPTLIWNETNLNDSYMQFNMPATVTAGNSVGWVSSFKNTVPGSLMLMPEHGVAYMVDTLAWIYSARQTINLSGIGVDFAQLDAGDYNFKSLTKIGSPQWGYTGYVEFVFKDGSGITLLTLTKGYMDLSPASQWLDYILDAPVPPFTRTIEIGLSGGLSERRAGDGSQPTTAFDHIHAELSHIDNDDNNIMLYGGVEYEAQNNGTTGATPSGFTHTYGELVQDGEVLWKCEIPKYTFLGTITQVYNNSRFAVSGISAPDNWFTWGVLKFLDGPNKTRGVEVLTFTANVFNLMLPALVPPEVGNHVMVHAGCDKTREIGGCLKFSNILNYRGEPEVPGTDQYFKVGGTGSSGAHSTSELPDNPFGM